MASRFAAWKAADDRMFYWFCYVGYPSMLTIGVWLCYLFTRPPTPMLTDADKGWWVGLIAYPVSLLTGLVVFGLARRAAAIMLATSPAVRKSLRITHRFCASALGAALVLYLTGAVVATRGGFVRAGPGGWSPLGALFEPSALFAWHPISMLAGTALFFPSSLDAVVMRFSSRDRRERVLLILVHAALQGCAAAVLSLGFTAIYLNKPAGGHFLTLHSLVGLAALVACALNFTGGFLNSLGVGKKSKAAKRKNSATSCDVQSNDSSLQQWVVLFQRRLEFALVWRDAEHRNLGSAAFLLLLGATATGLYNKVILLPEGWGGGWDHDSRLKVATPSAEWLSPGGTWSYSVLGHAGVCLMLASLFCVGVLGLWPPSQEEREDTSKGA
jgi:hypothetical protein